MYVFHFKTNNLLPPPLPRRRDSRLFSSHRRAQYKLVTMFVLSLLLLLLLLLLLILLPTFKIFFSFFFFFRRVISGVVAISDRRHIVHILCVSLQVYLYTSYYITEEETWRQTQPARLREEYDGGRHSTYYIGVDNIWKTIGDDWGCT